MATMKKPKPTLKAKVTTESQTRMTGSMNKPDLRTKGGGSVKVTPGKTTTRTTPENKKSMEQMKKAPAKPSVNKSMIAPAKPAKPTTFQGRKITLLPKKVSNSRAKVMGR